MIMNNNESTAGADASVEALKLYHMKLTLAYSSLLAPIAIVACQSGSLHCTTYSSLLAPIAIVACQSGSLHCTKNGK